MARHAGDGVGDARQPLRVVAEWNPVSAVAHAARERFGNLPAELAEPTAWPLEHAGLYAASWALIIIAVFAPLSVRTYRRATR